MWESSIDYHWQVAQPSPFPSSVLGPLSFQKSQNAGRSRSWQDKGAVVEAIAVAQRNKVPVNAQVRERRSPKQPLEQERKSQPEKQLVGQRERVHIQSTINT